jgi:hypothetical protein
MSAFNDCSLALGFSAIVFSLCLPTALWLFWTWTPLLSLPPPFSSLLSQPNLESCKKRLVFSLAIKKWDAFHSSRRKHFQSSLESL